MKLVQVESIGIEELTTAIRRIFKEELAKGVKAEILLKEYKLIEAARLLGVSTKAINTLVKSGTLEMTRNKKITGASLMDLKNGNVIPRITPGRKLQFKTEGDG
jgi:hypothetical protein